MQESILLSKNLTQTTKKLVASMSKKIENIEYLIKIEHHTVIEEDESYKKESQSVLNLKDKSDKELSETIEELNKKDKQIYETQKTNINYFHSEISKYDKIKTDMEKQIKQIESDLTNYKLTELKSYDNYNIINEDYLMTKSNVKRLKESNEALLAEIKQIESTYPNQFSFLFNELIQSKNNTQLDLKILSINKEIQSKEERKIIYAKDLDFKSKRLIENETQLALLSSENQFLQSENSIRNLEKQIEKYIAKDSLHFSSVKEIIYLYYHSKDYSQEDKINYAISKEIIALFKKLLNEIRLADSDLKQRTETEGTKLNNLKLSKSTKRNSGQISQMQIAFYALSHALNYHKDLIALVQKIIDKNEELSSVHFNDFFDDDYEKGLIDDLFSMIVLDLNREEAVNLKAILGVYFENVENKMKTIYYLNKQIESLKKYVEKDKNDIADLIAKMKFDEHELLQNKTELNQLNNELMLLNESIGAKSRFLKPQLEKLTVEDFERYLKANEAIIPKFNKKIKNKVLSVKKEEFIEQVIINHSAKKGRITECLEAIYSNQENIIQEKIVIRAIKPSVLKRKDEHAKDFHLVNSKYKEIDIIKDSIQELNKQIEEILAAQTESVIKEKKILQIQHNIPFYLNKVANTSEKIEGYNAQLEVMLRKYEKIKKHHEEKEAKLQHEVNELKERLSTLLSLDISNHNNNNNNQRPSISFPLGNIMIDEIAHVKTMPNNKQQLSQHQQDDNDDADTEILSKRSISSRFEFNDPFIQISLNNLSHLNSGLSLFKKLNQNPSVNSRIPVFNQKDSIEYPPERCGYAIRFFRISPNEEGIMIQNLKNNKTETRIPFESITGLMVDTSSRHVINRLKNNASNSLLTQGEYIQFTLVLKEGSVDIIAPNYSSYEYFQMGIAEIMKNKKKMKKLSKYINSNGDDIFI